MIETHRLLVAALVVLVGCSGPADTAPPTETVTAAPVPTADPPVRLAPGVTVGGVDDPVALAVAHRTALGGTTVTVRLEASRRYANGSLRWRRTATERVDATGRPVRSHYVGEFEGTPRYAGRSPEFGPFPDATRVERYSVGERGANRYRLRSGETWSVVGPSRPARLLDPGLVPLFWAVDTRTTGVETCGGTTCYRLEGDGVADRATLDRAFVGGETVDLRSVSVVALVDSRGVVHEYRLSFTAVEVDGTVIHGRESVRFTGVGETSVDRPAWYDEAAVGATG